MAEDTLDSLDAVAEPLEAPAAPESPALAPEPDDTAPAESADAAPAEDAAPQAAPPRAADAPSSEVAKYLRSLRADESGAKYSRAIEAAYFRDREFVKAFPTVEEARNARMLLDGVGGLDGIEELQRAGELLSELDEMAANGDPDLINRLAGDNPEGFAGLTEAGLEKLRQTNREAYDAVLRPHVIQALAGTNLSFALKSAADILSAGNAQGAYDYLQGILSWLDGLSRDAEAQRQRSFGGNGAAQGAPAAAPQTPQFAAALQAAAAPGVTQALRAAIQPYAEQRKLPEASRARLEGLVLAELDRQLGADDQYQRTLRTLARGQNAERAAKFVISKVDQAASRVAREVVNDLYPATAQRAANGAPGPPRGPSSAARAKPTPDNPGRPIMLTKGPRYEEVDWEHDPTKVLYVTHKAFLKDGRYVTWPK